MESLESCPTWRWCHSAASDRLCVWHDKLVGIWIKVCSITEIILIIILIVLTLRGWLGLIKILLIERSDSVGSNFGIIGFSNNIGRQWAEAHGETFGIKSRGA
jgi:hypothetical protein